MTGQSLTLILGTPLAAFLGAFIGWRGVNFCLAGLGVVAALGYLLTARAGRRSGAGAGGPKYRAALTLPVLRLLGIHASPTRIVNRIEA